MKRLDYLSRSQLQRIHRLGSDRNARRVLQEMEEYLSYFRDGEKVYYLNKEGRERVDCKKIKKKLGQVEHYLMRNELYIHLGQPSTWKNEMKFGLKDVAVVIADALFQKDNIYHIVEIDHTQKMSKNRSKVERYRKLAERTHLRLLWVTTTNYRSKQLEKLCEGLDVQIFTITDLS